MKIIGSSRGFVNGASRINVSRKKWFDLGVALEQVRAALAAQPSAQDREDAQRWRYWFQWFQSCDDPGEPAYPPDVDVIWHARPDMEFVEALDVARARGGSHA